MKRRVFFIIPPEVHLLDVSGPIHVFYEAAELGAELQMVYLSTDSDSTKRSSAGLIFDRLEDYQSYSLDEDDIVFIPGLDSKLIYHAEFKNENENFFSWLNLQAEKGTTICSVCTGAYLLGFAKVLSKKSCTTHWKYLDDFKKRFPDANLLGDRLFVKDGKIYSSAGVSSGIDLALYLLEEIYGAIFAVKVAKEIVIYLRRADADPQLSVFLQYRNHIEVAIHQVQDHLSQNLSEKNTIDDLARLVNMSPRNLTRLFRKATGVTIGEYTEKLKLEHASQMLAHGHKVDFVGHSVGLSSNQLRSLIKKYKQMLPSELS